MAGSNEKKNDKYSAIRGVLRKYSSFDKPMKLKDIQVILNQQEYDIKRHAITTAMDDMGVVEVESDTDYKAARELYMKKGERRYCNGIKLGKSHITEMWRGIFFAINY